MSLTLPPGVIRQAQIAGLNLTVGGHAIGGSAAVVPVDYEYEGNPAVAHGISGNYPDLTGTLLTDGNLGTTDWRSGYVGSQEPNSQGDSGRLQPRVSFDLGATYSLRSVTITYMVDQSAGIFAPDSVAVSVSTTGLNGTYGGTVVSTAFDDSPDGNPTTYFGAVRTLTVDLGGAAADAVRLDFLNDRSMDVFERSVVRRVVVPTSVGGRRRGARAEPRVCRCRARAETSIGNVPGDFLLAATRLPVLPNIRLGYTVSHSARRHRLGLRAGHGLSRASSPPDLDRRHVRARPLRPTSACRFRSPKRRLCRSAADEVRRRFRRVSQRVRNRPPQCAVVADMEFAATASRSDADAVVFATIDLPLSSPAPVWGDNVLAIRGLNDSATSSSLPARAGIGRGV